MPSHDEILEEFRERKAINDEEEEKEKAEKMKKKRVAYVKK